jgi:hypothetical protein
MNESKGHLKDQRHNYDLRDILMTLNRKVIARLKFYEQDKSLIRIQYQKQ